MAPFKIALGSGYMGEGRRTPLFPCKVISYNIIWRVWRSTPGSI